MDEVDKTSATITHSMTI